MGSPYIPYPNIPPYLGVPALTRPINVEIAETPALAIAIGSVENFLIGALQQAPQWGIFDSAGNQFGIQDNSTSILTALEGQFTGAVAPVLSTLSVDYLRESRVSDFPIEEGSFATYNKVQLPANPVVTLALDGQESDRTYFLQALDAACTSPTLYTVLTPTVTYPNCTIERYTYSRRSSRGATLLIAEISLKEVRQVSAAYTTIAIVNPQNAAATAPVNNGITQPAAPDVSTLKSLYNKLPSLAGVQ